MNDNEVVRDDVLVEGDNHTVVDEVMLDVNDVGVSDQVVKNIRDDDGDVHDVVGEDVDDD